MMTRKQAALICGAAITRSAAKSAVSSADRVHLLPIPQAGLQPQASVDDRGILHLVYFNGNPQHGDLFYVRSSDEGANFSSAFRVNSQAGSAIATGTIRGAQTAIGKAGRLHVAWNGSGQAEPKGSINPDSGEPGAPMLYSSLNDRAMPSNSNVT
jgi:hypothetical protein